MYEIDFLNLFKNSNIINTTLHLLCCIEGGKPNSFLVLLLKCKPKVRFSISHQKMGMWTLGWDEDKLTKNQIKSEIDIYTKFCQVKDSQFCQVMNLTTL